MEIGIIIHTIIQNKSGEVLIIKRLASREVEPGKWDIPGGTLEWGEDPEVGAKREIMEETGLTVGTLELFTHTSNIDQAKNKQFVRLIFRTDFNGGKIKLSAKEHDEYRWIKPEEIGNFDAVDYMPQALGKLV